MTGTLFCSDVSLALEMFGIVLFSIECVTLKPFHSFRTQNAVWFLVSTYNKKLLIGSSGIDTM